MDARVFARYFHVSAKPEAATQDFHEFLEECSQLQLVEREHDIGQQTIVRLERYERRGDFVYGEFNRIQRTNIPPQAGPDGLFPIVLEEGHGIGHLGSFQYHVPTRIILLQRNLLGATPSRLSVYLRMLAPSAFFTLTPVLRRDSLRRLQSGMPKMLTVGFATPSNLAVLEDAGVSGAKAAQRLGELYDAPEIEFTVGVGSKRGVYLAADRVVRAVQGLLTSNADMNALKVRVDTGEGTELIDLINEGLTYSETLTLPEGDPDANFAARKSAMAASFAANMDYILEHYGSGRNAGQT